jgi:hypothetical protein
MEQKYKVLHYDIELEFEIKKNEPYYDGPIGTQYEFVAYDAEERYLKLPWRESCMWIQTMPICVDVRAYNKEDLDYKVQYCKENNLRVGKIETIIVEKREPTFSHVLTNKDIYCKLLSLLLNNNADLITFPVKIYNLKKEYDISGLLDGIYNITSNNG